MTEATMDCPCTMIEQDENCPVGYPAMLCSVCNGIGFASQKDVSALAAEMLNIARELGEPDDPFAAWETLSLIRSENEGMRTALEPFRDCVVMTDRNRVIVGFETDRIAAQVADALADAIKVDSVEGALS